MDRQGIRLTERSHLACWRLLILVLGLGGLVVPAAAQCPATTLVSVNAAGTASGNGYSSPLALSRNGRLVLLSSNASDLVANDTNGTGDIFVRDLATGTTTLVS